jgi:CheY-like chemotaxis protein
MKKLLIVDDEDAMRGLYRRRLSGTYELFETGDPGQALALALEHKPDAILLDLRMPKHDGFELCQNFRALSYTSELPLFVVTGESGNHKKECEAMGATGYFEKPIDFDRLKRVLEETLASAPPARPGAAELRMRVMLKLKGLDAGGEGFEDRTETEGISADGFSCISARNLEDGGAVQVSLLGRTEVRVGMARPVERVSAGLERYRYRFVFEGERKNWILQNQPTARGASQSG